MPRDRDRVIGQALTDLPAGIKLWMELTTCACLWHDGYRVVACPQHEDEAKEALKAPQNPISGG